MAITCQLKLTTEKKLDEYELLISSLKTVDQNATKEIYNAKVWIQLYQNNKTMGIEICGITEIYIIALSARDLFRIAR